MRDKRAKSFVTIMIVIAILALLLRFAIDWIIKMNIAQNESNAQGTLKLIAVGLENYAKDNKGLYPASFAVLTEPGHPYLDKDYIAQPPIKGYDYSCPRLEPSGYSCLASPTKCKVTGNKLYTAKTGGLFIPEECDKKD